MGHFALRNINHNGVDYHRGDEVPDLSDESVQALTAAEALSDERPEDVAVAEQATPAPVEHADSHAEEAPSVPPAATEEVAQPENLTEAPIEQAPQPPAQPTEEQIQETLQASEPGSEPSLNA